MFVIYPAVFYKNREERGYTVVFPDLQGCVTGGETMEEAFEMAADALGAYLYEFYGRLAEMPKSSQLQDLKETADPESELYYDLSKSFTNLIGIDLLEYVRKSESKTVKKTLTIPSYLNEMAKEKGINFSKLLQEALKAEFDLP